MTLQTSNKVTYQLTEVVINDILRYPEHLENTTSRLARVLVDKYHAENVRASIEPYRESKDWSLLIVEGDVYNVEPSE